MSGLTYSRETEVIYRAEAGAHVGVVTCSPQEPLRYVFIHGPENPDSQWQYDFHHRRGVIVHDNRPGHAVTLDAFSITPPYQAGVLMVARWLSSVTTASCCVTLQPVSWFA